VDGVGCRYKACEGEFVVEGLTGDMAVAPIGMGSTSSLDSTTGGGGGECP
jgi:hypothetical protein